MLWALVPPASASEAVVAPSLVTVGGLTVDNVIAADGTVGLGQAGGNGAYSAVGALAFVPRVGLVSHAVASYPKRVIARLEAGGVDLGGVLWSPERLASCNWFIYDAAGRREEDLTSPPEALGAAGYPTDRLSPEEVVAWRDHLRAHERTGEVSYSEFRTLHPLDPKQVPVAWQGAKGVHLAPSQPDVMVAMLDLFGHKGAVITADPGWQLAARTLDEITPILARLDAFLPSEVELTALVPGAALADALSIVAARCKGAVAVKLGPEGVLVWDAAKGAAVAVPAKPVAALDPTGAGDSFCGGFLAGLVETGDPVQAASFGAVAASCIVKAFGADGALPIDRAACRAALTSGSAEMTPCH
ncbi:MAG: PfkB family carbohydrate kinase [Pseudomonadota bacterium]